MRNHRPIVLLTVGFLFACSISHGVEETGVTQSSRYVVFFSGPEVKAELVYRWASDHIGDEILVIKASLTATPGVSPKVDAGSIRVLTPDGRSLPLMPQKEFQRLAPKIRIALETMDAWGPPVSRLEGLGRACGFWFLAPANSFADRSSLRLRSNQWCSGPLVFTPPVGVQPGRWILVIDLEESVARIPFVLGD